MLFFRSLASRNDKVLFCFKRSSSSFLLENLIENDFQVLFLRLSAILEIVTVFNIAYNGLHFVIKSSCLNFYGLKSKCCIEIK